MRARLLLSAFVLLAASASNAAAQATVVFLANWNNSGKGTGQLYGPFDIACAPDGTVLVSDQIAVKRFTSAGVFLEQWLLAPAGINPHGNAALNAIDSQGNAYFPTGFGDIQKLTLDGVLLATLRLHSLPGDGAPFAWGVAVGSDGNIFVSDNYNRDIQKFSPNGQFLLRWGTQGAGPGQFLTVGGIAADHTGRLYAIDAGGAASNHRVEVFDLNGNFLFQFGSYGSGPGQFQSLGDIAVDASGYVYVSDQDLRRVQEFGPDGRFIAVLGAEGIGDGQFQVPYGIGTDAQGDVYVCDDSYSRIEKFGPAAVPAATTTWGRVKAIYHDDSLPQPKAGH